MKKFLILIVTISISASAYSDGSKYKIDDKIVLEMFSNAVETECNPDINPFNLKGDFKEKNAWKALILCSTYFGHRIYLGTSKGVIAGYICTGGGCGIITLVDAIVLFMGAIDGNIEPYIDNPSFFMW